MPELPSDLASAVDELLAKSDPSVVSAEAFLGERFDAGLAWLHLPPDCGGRNGDPDMQGPLEDAFAAAGAPNPFIRNPMAVGMVAPTVAYHGTDEQKSAYLRSMFTAEDIWCQLFSEPGAGSDLAALATRAIRDGDDWIVTGQKVWTSLGHLARWGFLLARTDPDVAKHKGMTCFVLDMTAPGVEIRPLRQMTGEAEFNEVFMDEVRIPDSSRVGDVNNGWTVAITTLMNERTSIGGAVAGALADPLNHLIDVYRQRHSGDDVARDRIMQLYIRTEILQYTAERARQAAEAGNPGSESSVIKLMGCELNQDLSNAIVDLLGAEGLLDEEPAADDDGAAMGSATNDVRRFLRARANTIEGGTSEVQRNVLGERVLGLPSEPRADRGMTWAETRS